MVFSRKKSFPVMHHPFGQKILVSLMEHYQKSGDIQTIGTIACIAHYVGCFSVQTFDTQTRLYADVLRRWGLDRQACDVEQAVRPILSLQSRSVSIHVPDTIFRCALCRLPTRGASAFCLVCGDGGHVRCMEMYLGIHMNCPGCRRKALS